MKTFCNELVASGPDLQRDHEVGTAVLAGLDRILRVAPELSAEEMFTRLLDLVLAHLSLRPRFRRFIKVASPGLRAGIPSPEGLTPLDQQFQDGSLIKNQAVSSEGEPTKDDLIAAMLVLFDTVSQAAAPGSPAKAETSE